VPRPSASARTFCASCGVKSAPPPCWQQSGQRSSKADFEQQLASVYSYDEDRIWTQAAQFAREEVTKPQAVIA
jgi:hypothetical protein